MRMLVAACQLRLFSTTIPKLCASSMTKINEYLRFTNYHLHSWLARCVILFTLRMLYASLRYLIIYWLHAVFRGESDTNFINHSSSIAHTMSHCTTTTNDMPHEGNLLWTHTGRHLWEECTLLDWKTKTKLEIFRYPGTVYPKLEIFRYPKLEIFRYPGNVYPKLEIFRYPGTVYPKLKIFRYPGTGYPKVEIFRYPGTVYPKLKIFRYPGTGYLKL